MLLTGSKEKRKTKNFLKQTLAKHVRLHEDIFLGKGSWLTSNVIRLVPFTMKHGLITGMLGVSVFLLYGDCEIRSSLFDVTWILLCVQQSIVTVSFKNIPLCSIL